MIKYLKKIIFTLIILILSLSSCVFAENLGLNFFYGINNVAKNTNLLPIELRIENKDNKDFKGYVNINIYETNDSVYVYKMDLNIPAKNISIINENISITNTANTIIIEIYNDKEELVTTDRTIIDLSYYDDRIIVGELTSDVSNLSYLNDLSLYDNTIRTQLVEINEFAYERNKNILNQLDILLISDVDMTKFGDSFNYAINNFVLNGKPVIIGLGGKNGIYSIPSILYSYLSGPTIETKRNLGKSLEINLTNFSFLSGKHIQLNDNLYIEYLKLENNYVVCAPFSFNEISEYRDNVKLATNVFEKGIGNNELLKFVNNFTTSEEKDYYHISNLLNIIDKLKLPDIFAITIILVVYISILTFFIYAFLRNINKRELYGRVVVVFSLIFTCIMMYLGYNVMKKNTFLTYISIVDIRDTSTKEKAFLNFRTSESGSYLFNTSANNVIYPLLKINKNPILSINFMNIEGTKYTEFYKKDGKINLEVNNAKDFDSNIFVYENSNYLNDVYNVDCEVNRFDGEVTGRITNKMDIKINEASILLFGKVVKIGDIDANRSVSLSRAEKIGAPIGNNEMLSEMMCGGNNQNILKFYLDENINGYYDYAILFGFIDNNGTIDLNSNDVGDVYGRTLIARRIPIGNEKNKTDICSLENEVKVIYGYYNESDNSTDGRSELINEYSFDKNKQIEQIYFEELSSYDRGKLDYNVQFYGEVSIYNRKTKNYDILYSNKINKNDISLYLSDDKRIIVRYVPSSIDPLYRNLSLPLFRAVINE